MHYGFLEVSVLLYEQAFTMCFGLNKEDKTTHQCIYGALLLIATQVYIASAGMILLLLIPNHEFLK